MNAERLLEHFDLISDAPDAVPRLRRFVLDLAVRGALVAARTSDAPADVPDAANRPPQAKAVELPIASLPFTVPSTWRWAYLTEVADVLYGFAFASGRFNASRHGMPLIRIRDISSPDTEAYFDGEYEDRYVVRNGDYLIGMDGDFNVRKWAGRDALLNQRVLRINKWHSQAAAGWCAIPLQMILDHIHGQTSQTTVKHLSAKQMNGVRIPLPPLAEQHRIVAKTAELMALCDQLEAAQADREARRDRLVSASLARVTEPAGQAPSSARTSAQFHLDHFARLLTRPEHVKQLRQTILDLAVRGRLTRQETFEQATRIGNTLSEAAALLPATWAVMTLSSLLDGDSQNGFSQKPDDAPDGVPILRISAGTVRTDGLVAEEEYKLIGGVSAAQREQYQVLPGDLLACRFNGNKRFVGRLTIFRGYSGKTFLYPDKLIRLRVNTYRVIPELLRYFGESDLVRAEIEGFCATTVGNWGISAANLKAVRFPIPPLAEQSRIVAIVDELTALCDQLDASLCSTATDRSRLLEAALREALTTVM